MFSNTSGVNNMVNCVGDGEKDQCLLCEKFTRHFVKIEPCGDVFCVECSKIIKIKCPKCHQLVQGAHKRSTTYSRTKYLYHLVMEDNNVEFYDENFFNECFLSIDEEENALKNYFRDKMIVAIFDKVSKNQSLYDKTIEKLLSCVGDLNFAFKSFLKIDNEEDKDMENAIKILNFAIPDQPNELEKELCVEFEKTKTNIECETSIDKLKKKNSRIASNFINQLVKDVHQCRLFILSAIFNCGKKSPKVITKGEERIISGFKDEDKNYEILSFNIIGLNVMESKRETFEKYFEKCLDNLEKDTQVDVSFSFVKDHFNHFLENNEKNDKKVIEKLIVKILNLIRDCALKIKRKIDFCKIVTCYVKYDSSNVLNKEMLNICIGIIANTIKTINFNNVCIRNEILFSMVLSTNNNNLFPDNVVSFLAYNLEELDRNSRFLITVFFKKCFKKIPKECIGEVSKMLYDNKIVFFDGIHLVEGTDITKSFSNYTARFLLCLFRETKDLFKDNDIKNIEECLKNLVSVAIRDESCIETSAKIFSAKALYIASDKIEINDFILKEIGKCTFDEIIYVSAYSMRAFVRALEWKASRNKDIKEFNFNFLFDIYNNENILIKNKDIEEILPKGTIEEVKENIFKVLEHEVDKRKFSEKVFGIFEHILQYDEKNCKKALEILKKYVSKKCLCHEVCAGCREIPIKVINALEDILDSSDGTESLKNLKRHILKKVIENGQKVDKKCLNIFCDYFYFSNNDESDNEARRECFDALNHAERNQELPEELFVKKELQRAAYFIFSGDLDEKLASISYIKTKVDNGVKLPIDTLNSLSVLLNDEDVLSILIGILKNYQEIPDCIINQLNTMFDPSKAQVKIIKIFENIEKKNQNISFLIKKLEKGLENDQISDLILSIFIHKGQKGEKLSLNVLNKMCDRFLSTKNEQFKIQLLSTIITVIEKNDFNEKRLKNVLIEGIKENKNMEICIKGFEKLIISNRIDDNCKEALIKKLSEKNLDELRKEKINSILNDCKDLNENCKKSLEFVNLKDQKGKELLDNLKKYAGKTPFVNQNFVQLISEIDNNPELQEGVLEILLECTYDIKDFPDELMVSVAILYSSTKSNKKRELCRELMEKLFNNFIGSRRTIIDKVLLILVDDGTEKSIFLLEKVAKSQTVLPQVDLLLRINNINSLTEERDFNILIEDINQMKSFQLNEYIIRKLLNFQQAMKGSQFKINLKALSTIFSNFLKQFPDYFLENKDMVIFIEDTILSKDVNAEIVKGYTNIVRRMPINNLRLDFVIDALVDLFGEEQELESRLDYEIINSISKAAEMYKIPQSGLELLGCCIKEENYSYLSFAGLRVAIKERNVENINVSKDFECFCNDHILNFENNINAQVDFDYDLIDILCSLNFMNNKIAGLPQEKWKKNLLLFDLLSRYEINVEEMVEFNDNWAKLEKKPQFDDKRCEEILRILRNDKINDELTFEQLKDMVFFLTDMEFETVKNILFQGDNHHINIKQMRIKKLLKNLETHVNSNYLKRLTLKISNQTKTVATEKLINSLSNKKNIKELESLIDLIEANNVNESDISEKEIETKELINKLDRVVLIEKITEALQNINLENKFKKVVANLYDKGWAIEDLKFILDILKESNSTKKVICERKLLYMIELLDQYISKENTQKFTCNFGNSVQTIMKSDSKIWLKEINKILMESVFQQKIEKDFDKLLDELIENNKKENKDSGIKEKLKNSYKKFLVEKKKSLPSNKNKIREWSKKNEKWFKEHDNVIESLAVIENAISICKKKEITKFQFTLSQILSLLLALEEDSKKGVLLQVATGEGKSFIVSVLAIVKKLQGLKVDIITSSKVLAERDAKEMSKLYAMFDLSCTDNSDGSSGYVEGLKKCYECDIVYGHICQFQYDSLRHEYSGLNTRGVRKYEFTIVDEVDSMLIDDRTKSARLTSKAYGLDLLLPVYFFIWRRVLELKKKVITIDQKTYVFKGEVEEMKKGILTLLFLDEDKESRQIENLIDYIEENNGPYPFGELIEKTPKEYIIEEVQSMVNDLFKDGDIQIPANLLNYVKNQMPKRIENAIIAYEYQENVNYVIQEGKINPVDYQSTGIVQASSVWSTGLHQFLQIKHRLTLSPETLTTNFMSNIGYFEKYRNNLLGLTGTLGSDKTQELLSEVYEVNLFHIPTRFGKQFIELPNIVLKNEYDWLDEIGFSAQCEVEKKRGILIICKTIRYAEQIRMAIEPNLAKEKIKLYTMNGKNQEDKIKNIESGEIIIATNLAGRGTDIRTSEEVEEHGGLHVILTFLPSNQRVEDQAFGRTARQGKRGTGQMILNKESLKCFDRNSYSSKDLKGSRDTNEATMLVEYMEKKLNVIRLKQNLFQKFCELIGIIRRDIKSKIDERKKEPVFEVSILNGVEERWALFLHEVDNGKIKEKEAEMKYNEFERKIKDDYKEDKVIENPFYYIKNANYFLRYYDKSKKDKYDEANVNFNDAIGKDCYISAAAFVGKARLLLAKDKNCDLKRDAVENFTKAVSILEQEDAQITGMLSLASSLKNMFSSENVSNVEDILIKQLEQKKKIIFSYLRSLQQNIHIINKSRRLIDIKCINSTEENGISKKIKVYDKIDRVYSSVDEFLRDSGKYEVIFSGLTQNANSDQDQALKIIRSTSGRFSIELESFNVEGMKLLSSFKETSIEFSSLDQNRAKDIIDSINKDEINLTIISNNVKELKSIIENENISSVEFCVSDGKFFETVNLGEARKRIKKIQDNKEDSHVIKFENLKLSVTKKFVKSCPSSEFNINFDISSTSDLEQLKKVEFSVNINNLDRSDAINLVETLRKNNIDFNLGVMVSDSSRASKLITGADLEQQDIKIDSVKLLKDREELTSDQFCTSELEEFASRGIEYIMEISEKIKIPWKDIFLLGIMAGAQIIAGAALALGSAGLMSNIGAGLFWEGVSDIFTAYNAYKTGKFSWKEHLISKAKRIAIKAATFAICSWSGIQDGIGALINPGGGADLWKDLAMCAIFKVGESLVAPFLAKLMGYAFGKLLEKFRPFIREKILDALSSKVTRLEFDILSTKMFVLDKLRSQVNEEFFKELVAKVILESKKEVSLEAKGFAENTFDELQSVMPSNVFGFLKDSLGTIFKAIEIIDIFYEKLLEELFIHCSQSSFKMMSLIENSCNIDSVLANKIVKELKKKEFKIILQKEKNGNCVEYLNGEIFEKGTVVDKNDSILMKAFDKINFGQTEEIEDDKDNNLERDSLKGNNKSISNRDNKNDNNSIETNDDKSNVPINNVISKKCEDKDKVFNFFLEMHKLISSQSKNDYQSRMKEIIYEKITDTFVEFVNHWINSLCTLVSSYVTSWASKWAQDKMIRKFQPHRVIKAKSSDPNKFKKISYTDLVVSDIKHLPIKKIKNGGIIAKVEKKMNEIVNQYGDYFNFFGTIISQFNIKLSEYPAVKELLDGASKKVVGAIKAFQEKTGININDLVEKYEKFRDKLYEYEAFRTVMTTIEGVYNDINSRRIKSTNGEERGLLSDILYQFNFPRFKYLKKAVCYVKDPNTLQALKSASKGNDTAFTNLFEQGQEKFLNYLTKNNVRDKPQIPFLPVIQDLFKRASKIIINVVNKLKKTFRGAEINLCEFFEQIANTRNNISKIFKFKDDFLENMYSIYEKISEKIKEFKSLVSIEDIYKKAKKYIDEIKKNLSFNIVNINNFYQEISQFVNDKYKKVIHFLYTFSDLIKKEIPEMINKNKIYFKDIIANIKEIAFFKKIKDVNFVNFFETAENMYTKVSEAIENVISMIPENVFKGLIEKIENIKNFILDIFKKSCKGVEDKLKNINLTEIIEELKKKINNYKQKFDDKITETVKKIMETMKIDDFKNFMSETINKIIENEEGVNVKEITDSNIRDILATKSMEEIKEFFFTKIEKIIISKGLKEVKDFVSGILDIEEIKKKNSNIIDNFCLSLSKNIEKLKITLSPLKDNFTSVVEKILSISNLVSETMNNIYTGIKDICPEAIKDFILFFFSVFNKPTMKDAKDPNKDLIVNVYIDPEVLEMIRCATNNDPDGVMKILQKSFSSFIGKNLKKLL